MITHAGSLAFALCLCIAVRASSESYTYKPVVTGGGGGFIVDIVFHPAEKDLIYAKTDMGGAYRWIASTSTWKQLFAWLTADDWNWSGMEALAVDPSDPDKLYVAAGTYTNSWTGTNNDGLGAIFRSSDRGETWEKTIMSFKMGGNMPGRGMGERLAVDPNLGSIMYFGARNMNGLWKSTDSGVTWTNVTNFPDLGPFCGNSADSNDYLNQQVGIPWIIFDPNTGTTGSATKTIYVGVANNKAGKANIYRSTDAGATWSTFGAPTCKGTWGGTVNCTGGRSWTAGTENSYSGYGVGYLPHQGKVDSDGVLYVTYSDWEGPYNGAIGAVFKYNGTWYDITPCTSSNNYCTLGSLYYGFGGLGVDMQNSGTIVVAGVNSWWPQGVMFRTTNGGQSWTPAWQYTSYPSTSKVFTMDITNAPWLNFGDTDSPPVPAVNLGWMMEGLNIDPFNSDRMMYGTGATLYATTKLTNWDNGGNFTIKSTAMGIEEASVLGMVSPPSGGGAHLYTVMSDISGFKHDDLDTAPDTMYTVPYAGSWSAIDFAELKPQYMVRVGTGSTSYYGNAWTTSGGSTWWSGSKDVVTSSGGGTVAAASDFSRVIWAGSSAAVSYSSDYGSSWVSCSGIPAGSAVASDRVNPKKFYGFGSGSFYYSTNAGTSFNKSSATGLPVSGASVNLRAVFGYEGHVWLAGGSTSSTYGLWYSTDGGVSFTKVSSLEGATVVGFGKAATNGTYPTIFINGILAGESTHGLYRSVDMGSSWVKISDDSHNYATVQTITGDPQIYGRVYFGTNGMGAIYGDLADGSSAVVDNTPVASSSSVVALAASSSEEQQQVVVVSVSSQENAVASTTTETSAIGNAAAIAASLTAIITAARLAL